MKSIVRIPGLYRNITFQVEPYDVNWPSLAAVYAFISPPSDNALLGSASLKIFYIGETDSLQRRMLEHRTEKWVEAQRLGATRVATLVVPHDADRSELEEELIRLHRPPLNETFGDLGGTFTGQRNKLFDV